MTRDEGEFPNQCKARTSIKKISPCNQPINQNLSSSHGVTVAASVSHWLHVFPPSAFLVTSQTDSCVLQTSMCKWPVESCDYSPFLWCAPTREIIRTNHSALPSRSGLANILIALLKLLLLFFFSKSLLPSEPVIFITYSVLQSLWFHIWRSTSSFCFILWDSALCEFEIHLAFCHQLLARFTFCKVKLMIVILVAGGLERLTDHGCSEIGNRPISWHIPSWFAFFLFFLFLGYKSLVMFNGKKIRKFSEAERKIQTHWSYYPKIASMEASSFYTFSIFIHTLKLLYTFINFKNTMHHVL